MEPNVDLTQTASDTLTWIDSCKRLCDDQEKLYQDMLSLCQQNIYLHRCHVQLQENIQSWIEQLRTRQQENALLRQQIELFLRRLNDEM